jgi:hypothetical protein
VTVWHYKTAHASRRAISARLSSRGEPGKWPALAVGEIKPFGRSSKIIPQLTAEYEGSLQRVCHEIPQVAICGSREPSI